VTSSCSFIRQLVLLFATFRL